MSSIPTVNARDQLADILNRVAYGGERITLTRRGKPVAAIVSVDDLELLEVLESKTDLEDARAALAEASEQGTIAWEAIKSELGL